MATPHYHYAIGRRKSSTARVRLTSGKGAVTINGIDAETYFAQSKYLAHSIQKPVNLLEQNGKYDISIVVSGGGLNGQAGAIQLAIAKCLVSVDDKVKSTLKRAGLLSRDPREKERKKFGLKGARKQRQFTKR